MKAMVIMFAFSVLGGCMTEMGAEAQAEPAARVDNATAMEEETPGQATRAGNRKLLDEDEVRDALAADELTAEITGKPPGEARPEPFGAVYGCGSWIGYGDWVLCGTVFLGESTLRIYNPNGFTAYAKVSYVGETAVAIPPGQTFFLVRWFWGQNLWVQNVGPGMIHVGH